MLQKEGLFMGKKTKINFTLCYMLLLMTLGMLNAEQLQSSKWGYSLDLPEGYVLDSSQNGDRFQFSHTMLPVTLVIASYTKDRYENSTIALNAVYENLSLKGESETLRWRNEENAVGFFTLSAGGVGYTGWAASIALPEEKGTAVFLCYSPTTQFAQNEQIIISTLDSIDVLQGTILHAGILTTYAYPKEGDQSVELDIDGKKITTVIDKSDIAASDFIVQREYDILTFFANTPLWKEAWQRFYRVIYRDSYKRLQRVSFSIYNALYLDIETDDKAEFDRALTQKLLTWVQGFTYERIPLGTDFVPLPAAISGEGSDCDSRALLLSVLMSQMRYETMLFISREYGHALFGISIAGDGARLEHNGIHYLLGETTAPIALGLVPQDMSEVSKWIGIDGL